MNTTPHAKKGITINKPPTQMFTSEDNASVRNNESKSMPLPLPAVLTPTTIKGSQRFDSSFNIPRQRTMAGLKSFVDPHGVSVHDQRKIEMGYISLESSLRAPQHHHMTHSKYHHLSKNRTNNSFIAVAYTTFPVSR